MNYNTVVGAVVVLYQPLIKEIENINRYINKVYRLVIIDNSNQDNFKLVNEILGFNKSYEYISHTNNIGLCKALNEGLSILFKSGCKWAIVFDSDSKIVTDIFQVYNKALNNYMRLNQIAIFAPQHTFDRNNKKVYQGYKNIKWAMTSGWFINLPIFFEIGEFFEPLFVDGLDIDYCYRATEKGFKIIECGEAIIKHHPAETKCVRIFGKNLYYGYASSHRYYMQARCLIWNSLRYKKLFDLAFYMYKWVKVLLLFDHKSKYIHEMIKGTREGLLLYKQYNRRKL